MSEQPSSKDDVRRGLGMLPQQADLQKSWTCTGLHCLPLCASIKWQRNHSWIGNNFSALPVANLSTSWNPLLLFFTCAQIGYQWFLKNPSIRLVHDLGTSEIPDTAPLAKLARSYLVQSLHKVKTITTKINFCPNWAEVIFYSRRVVGDFTFRQTVGKLRFN